MKRIYTYGGHPVQRNLTMACIQKNKAKGIKMSEVDAVNYEEAEVLERAGVDLIFVADTDIVETRRGAPNTFITAGFTMNQYVTEDDALGAAIRCAEKGADAIYTPRGLKTIERLAGEGLCVKGHLGLVPRISTRVGGLRLIGKTAEEAIHLMDDFSRLHDAGAVAAEVECVAKEAMAEISKRIPTVTHSIGSGSGGDVIWTFMCDICGDTENPPRHAKAFADMLTFRKQMEAEREKGVRGYHAAVKDGSFPCEPHEVPMAEGEHEKLLEAFDKWTPIHQ